MNRGSFSGDLFIVIKITFFFCLIPGEDELSFAYDGRGKKVSSRKEEEFGEPFSDGDIIGCYAVSDTFLFNSSFIHILETLQSLINPTLFLYLSYRCAVQR